MKTKPQDRLPMLFVNLLAYGLCFLWLIPVVWMAVVTFKPDRVDTTKDRKSTRLNSSHRCISSAVF